MRLMLVWLLSLVGALSSGVSVDGGKLGGEKVSIGAILGSTTMDGQVMKIAMETAVHDINSNRSILGGRMLSLRMLDSNHSGFVSIMSALQFMEQETVSLIVSQTSVMAHVLWHLANELHVPLLSFTALDPAFSTVQYPYLLQTAPSDLDQMAALADMINYFGWSQLVAIYTDDEQHRNGITALGDQLFKINCFVNKVTLPPVNVDQTLLVNELLKVKMMGLRVVVLHIPISCGIELLKLAQKLGMLETGYIWIATSWLSTALDSNLKLNKFAQGVLTLRPHTPDSEKKRYLNSRWSHLSNGSADLTAYGLYAYDTILVITSALKAFFDNGNDLSFSSDPALRRMGGRLLNLSALSIFDGGKKLLDAMLDTHLTGLTGPISFNSTDRSLSNPPFDVINVVKNQLRVIGYWSKQSGITQVSPDAHSSRTQNRSMSSQLLGSVVWPGGSKTKPLEWTFPPGKKLRVGVPLRVSFQDFVSRNHTHATGYCIDVFTAALRLLPYAVHYEFKFIGDGHKNPSYDDLVKLIGMNELDAAVGDITIINNRTRIADFTQPYAASGLVVLALVKKVESSTWAFARPFSPALWAITGACFLLVGTVIWVLEHRINEEFRGTARKQVVTLLWFSFSTLFYAHRENTVSTLGRVVLVLWLFAVLVIQSSYTASLTSMLTVEQLSSEITGIDSLTTSNDRIGYQVGSFAASYLHEQFNIPNSRLIALSGDEYANALLQGRVAAVVDEKPYIDLFLSNHCQFSIAGLQFTKTDWGFAFQKGSPLAPDLSTAILKLAEDGTLQKINDHWLGQYGSCDQHASRAMRQLEDFAGLFSICGVACFLALLIFFFKVLRKYKHHIPEISHSPSYSGSFSARLRTFVSFIDQKEDDINRKLEWNHTFQSEGEKQSQGTHPLDTVSDNVQDGNIRKGQRSVRFDIAGERSSASNSPRA